MKKLTGMGWLSLLLIGLCPLPGRAAPVLNATQNGVTASQPVGANVSSVTNNQTQTTNTTINQTNNRVVIDWLSFSIANGESVVFNQPSTASVALNRVLGTDPSQIFGNLTSNGQVFLFNPNGIFFAPGSTVNVGALVATTLATDPTFFLNPVASKGNPSAALTFQNPVGTPLAFVINQGTITASSGFVVLASPLVDNGQTINAGLSDTTSPLLFGQVTLAGCTLCTIDNAGNVVIPTRDSSAFGDVIIPASIASQKGAVSDFLIATVNNKNLVQAGTVTQNVDGSVTLGSAEGVVVQEGIQINVDALGGGAPAVQGSPTASAGNIVLDSTQATNLTAATVMSASGVNAGVIGGNITIHSQGFVIAGDSVSTDNNTGQPTLVGGILNPQQTAAQSQANPPTGDITTLVNNQVISIINGGGDANSTSGTITSSNNGLLGRPTPAPTPVPTPAPTPPLQQQQSQNQAIGSAIVPPPPPPPPPSAPSAGPAPVAPEGGSEGGSGGAGGGDAAGGSGGSGSGGSGGGGSGSGGGGGVASTGTGGGHGVASGAAGAAASGESAVADSLGGGVSDDPRKKEFDAAFPKPVLIERPSLMSKKDKRSILRKLFTAHTSLTGIKKH